MTNFEGFRLSSQQTRLCLVQQSTSPSIRVPLRALCAIRIRGNLDPERLKEAVEGVVARHEILRTSFHRLPGINLPFQVIAESSRARWHEQDLSDQSLDNQKSYMKNLFQEEANRPVDFEQKALLDLLLIRLSENESLLLISLPSLSADTSTFHNLLYEISVLYAANDEDELDDEVLQYVDFCEWQHELLEGGDEEWEPSPPNPLSPRERGSLEEEEEDEDEDAEAGRAYWRQQLAVTRSDDFSRSGPRERLKSSLQGAKMRFLTVEVEAALSGQLEQYESATSTFLLACWQTLLWRLTGQEQVVVGTIFDGRKYEDLEDTLGPLGQALPTSCNLEAGTPFSTILSQIDESVGEAGEWLEYFSWDAWAETDMPLFAVGFEFEERPESYEAEEVELSIYNQNIFSEPFKVKLTAVQKDDTLTLTFAYNGLLFEEETIKRLAGQFQTLLASALSQPDVAADELNLLTDREREQLLVEFNDTRRDYPKESAIHHLFEQQVERTPNHIALVYEEQQLTYAELNAQANQLAHTLIKQGVGPDAPIVALCVERSLDMMIGMLGILKAGGAYLPLDPQLPAERLAFMLEDTQAPLLLTQSHLVEKLPAHNAQIIRLDVKRVPPLALGGVKRVPPLALGGVRGGRDVSSRHLVYVLFTSGSTGKPKGVAVEHRQLVNYTSSIIERLDFPAEARSALVSTFAADLGNTVIYPTLCTGGTLYIASQEQSTNPEAFAAYFEQHPIDCLKITPSHLSALLSASKPEAVLPRKRLILGGEASSWKLIEQVHNLLPECRVFNHYGPTETTVGVLTYAVPKGDKRNPPLGRPIANTQLYILDPHLQPVPIGVAGELHIGGDNVTRGYLNRPDLTQERFIANPFGAGRLYKTGDKARYLADGHLEFLGRIDHQVKLRGFRIELGEIEAVLRQHEEVREAVVTVRESEQGQQLVAYLVLRNIRLTNSKLRTHLAAKLPDYMMPNAFVLLETLPLTPNGKIDRRRLPTPESRSGLEEAFVPPRDVTEQQLAFIWQDILGVHSVGAHDNFFNLGGHSLLAVRMMARIQQQFGQNLPLATLFQRPTVDKLANLLREQSDSISWSSLVAIQSGGKKPPIFAIPGAGGNVIYFYKLAHHLGPQQPFYGLQAVGLDGEADPYTTVEEMASHYIKEIQSVQPEGPYRLAGHSLGGKIAFEMAQRLQQMGHEVAQLVIFDTPAPEPAELREWSDAQWLTDLAEAIEEGTGQQMNVSYDALLPLGPDEQLLYFKERLELANLLPTDSELKQVRGTVQVYKTGHQTNYMPTDPIIPTPITLFRSEEGLERFGAQHEQPTWGWEAFGAVETIDIPGDHITMMAEPHVEVLAERLSAVLQVVSETK